MEYIFRVMYGCRVYPAIRSSHLLDIIYSDQTRHYPGHRIYTGISLSVVVSTSVRVQETDRLFPQGKYCLPQQHEK